MKIRSRYLTPRYFKLYKQANDLMRHIENSRGGTFGIAANPVRDEYAGRWQMIRMRVELLEAFLEDRNPNWFNCYYIKC